MLRDLSKSEPNNMPLDRASYIYMVGRIDTRYYEKSKIGYEQSMPVDRP